MTRTDRFDWKGDFQMTRKDYELIAKVINKRVSKSVSHFPEDLTVLAEDIAVALQDTNPSFDQHRFLKACGVREEGRV